MGRNGLDSMVLLVDTQWRGSFGKRCIEFGEEFMGNRIPELDVSSRAGMLLAGFSAGRPTSPTC